MTFAWPNLLWLLIIPAALLAWDIARGRKAAGSTFPKILRAEAGTSRLVLSSRQSESSRLRPRLLLACGLALGVAALARPQWGLLEEQVFDRSREILITVDLSRSMLVTDIKPSRLERSKLLIQALLERLQGERVGLMLFAGTAFVQSPLSSDYEILLEFLPELGPKYLPAGGSDYGRMLDAALGAFSADTSADRFLVVLSDGEATDEGWRARLDELKSKGIRVIGLGVGTAEGGLVPDGSGAYIKDDRGAVVLSKLEPKTLQELAKETNGVYRDASAWVDLPALIQETIATGQRGAFVEEIQVRRIERFQWALAPALFLLILSFWREFPVRPRPRHLHLVSPANGAAAQAAGAVVALALAILPCATRGAEEVDTSVAAAPVSKVVARLSGQTAHSAANWAELARTTITYGQQVVEMKQPVPEGPVQDALEGVAKGSALDARAADWPQLRRDLEALLKKEDEPPPPEEPPPPQPEEQKQDQQKGGSDNKDGDKNEPSEQSKDQEKSDQSEKSKEDQKQDADGQPQDKDDAFGDMDEQKDDQEVEEPPEESQKVGGTPHSKADPLSSDPSLAMPLQRLDQLRDLDSPAELYQRMDQAENPNQKRSDKDW